MPRRRQSINTRTRANQRLHSGELAVRFGKVGALAWKIRRSVSSASGLEKVSVGNQDSQRPIGERYRMRISFWSRASFLNEYG
jgi:hypothetical protein